MHGGDHPFLLSSCRQQCWSPELKGTREGLGISSEEGRKALEDVQETCVHVKCCLPSLQPMLDLGYLLIIFSQDLEHGLFARSIEFHPLQVTRICGLTWSPKYLGASSSHPHASCSCSTDPMTPLTMLVDGPSPLSLAPSSLPPQPIAPNPSRSRLLHL